MSREEWRNKIAKTLDDGVVEALRRGHNLSWEEAADAVLALLEKQGRTLWWCPATQLGLTVNDRCHRSRHRQGTFIELDKP